MSDTVIKNGSGMVDKSMKATGPLGLAAALFIFFGGRDEVMTLRQEQGQLRERVAAAEAMSITLKEETNRRLERIEALLDRMDAKIDRLASN